MKSRDIRQKFFDFFVQRSHTIVPSSSLIPAQDPTLLFTNAGMNQFKDVFLGKEKRSYTRAVSIQKCVRAGGKHNDLDNVGFTKRHLTFFEMMGNFSFGDYFKKDAIHFAWDFLVKELKLPVEKLHATVYKTDDEAYDIWHKEIGIPAERMHRLGENDNFWQMGETGPCGPCTEIHIDRGASFGCDDIKACGPACDCDRFLEIWNLVFMQFDRQSDGTDKPLKQTGVDTGMGLERLCSVVQDKDSVYGTDLFTPIIAQIEKMTGINYQSQDAQKKAAFHVLADHIRSSTMIIADGAAPSNEGRGYVLRKIIRRAALFAQKLSADQKLFPELSRIVVQEMGEIYPELKNSATLVYKVLESEISKFSANLVRGQAILNEYFQQSDPSLRSASPRTRDERISLSGHPEPVEGSKGAHSKIITGAQAFKLYDTYGFPLELIEVIAKENGFTVDEQEFHAHMQKQQEQSGKKVADELAHVALDEKITTEFTGYHELQTTSKVSALISGDKLVDTVPAGTKCWVITAESPFFIVGGGQVPDQGWLEIENKRVPLEQVRFIGAGNAIGALITTPDPIKVGQTITSIVDPVWRTNAMKNHTATHLLQAALIELLGKTIKQSGSLVHPDYLRFDFTYHENLSPAQIQEVEDLVNEKIRENLHVNIEYMSLTQATKKGALAFFGDKYNPEKVRMIEIPGFSTELCGGTHVPQTGVIGVFKITEVTALSAGQRRIVAVTGPKALALFQETFEIVKDLGQEFKVQREHVLDAVVKQKQEVKALQTQIKQLKKLLFEAQIPALLQTVEAIKNVPFGFMAVADASSDEIKELAQQLQTKKPGLYVLFSVSGDKTLCIISLSPTMTTRVNLKNLAAWLKDTKGIKGGVTETLFQGGLPQIALSAGAPGTKRTMLPEEMAKAESNLKSEIGKWLMENISG
jgi:alanyl-tRNA synthetase